MGGARCLQLGFRAVVAEQSPGMSGLIDSVCLKYNASSAGGYIVMQPVEPAARPPV